ncbi:MAG: TonB-dependent receptor [Muribaculaceae bacterium]|nr:TonB-dependent receptor [Muribaculaceae bacterium]
MKKTLLTVAATMATLAAVAQPAATDTVPTIALSEVEVLGTRASENTPVAYSNVTGKQIAAVNHGLDIPFLLTMTPSVITTSDAGAGVGYTSMRVRGTDATRINITVNDIPLNDSESHSVFWVNTPDFASSVRDMQVQRGVGTSTNGAGAFGASVNMRTQGFSRDAFAEVSGSYGSFNTNKETLRVGSGLLGDHWSVEARLSHIGSDGYRDRASSELVSYYGQLGYFGGGTSLRFITFGGKEDTYHAWDGISRDDLKDNRTYNPNGEIKHDGKVTGFYKDQKDIYRQTHYQLIWNQTFTPQWKLNVALHYTDGYGYYQEYKNARTLKEYGLEPVVTPEGTSKKASLVRKKCLDSGFGGGVFSLQYSGERLAATLGGGINRYTNDHYGQVIWVENYTSPLAPDHEYYRNYARKNDFNVYIKGNYVITGGLSAYADLQYRHIGYRMRGDNDKWDWTASPEHLQVLDIDEPFDFFNPKAGLNWQMNEHNRFYASFAVAQKEPTRNNYNDGPLVKHPTSEKLYDWEVGYELRSGHFSAGVNGYYMKYKDQLVLNGKINEIGELMAENVPDSYRMGVELMAGYRFTDWLRWDVNATLSRNRIKDYVGYVSDYDADTWDDMWTQTEIHAGDKTIAFSPSVTVGSLIALDYKGFTATLQSQYVSRQYLDNFERKEDSLDPYFVNNLDLAYTFKLPHLRSVTVGATIYNLLDEKYETNGYSQTCALYPGGSKDAQYSLYSDPRFYPMAGINALGHVTLRF